MTVGLGLSQGALARFAHLDHTLAESEGRIPRNLDGVFDALMRGTTLRVHPKRTLDRFAVLDGCNQVIVNCNRLDPNCSTYANDAAVNSGSELVAVERNLAP